VLSPCPRLYYCSGCRDRHNRPRSLTPHTTTGPLQRAEAHGREQLAGGCYSTAPRPGIELILQVQRPEHYIT